MICVRAAMSGKKPAWKAVHPTSSFAVRSKLALFRNFQFSEWLGGDTAIGSEVSL